jgi:hypothetical protein
LRRFAGFVRNLDLGLDHPRGSHHYRELDHADVISALVLGELFEGLRLGFTTT